MLIYQRVQCRKKPALSAVPNLDISVTWCWESGEWSCTQSCQHSSFSQMSFRFLASEASKEDHSKCLAGCTFPASDMYINPYSSLQPSFGDGLSRKPFISSGGILVTSNCGFLGTKGDRGLWENYVCHTGFPGQDLSFFVQRSALSLQIILHSGLQISIDFYKYFYNYFYNYFDYFDYFDCFHITFTSDLLQQFPAGFWASLRHGCASPGIEHLPKGDPPGGYPRIKGY